MEELESIEQTAFGDVLKSFRKRRGLSQQYLATMLDIHRNTIGAWERGDNLPESKAIVLELAFHLGLNERETRFLLEASLTSLSSHWNVPYPRNPFFTGREELLQQLHRAFLTGKTKISRSAQPCALHGLGGIGKTQTVVEYAYRHDQDYTAVFWIQAETRETLFASILSIAECLPFPDRFEQELDQVVDMVKHWLTVHRNWLLILDNVEDIGLVQPFFATARQGAILLTTRLQAFAGLAQMIEMQPLTLLESSRFLLRRVKHLSMSVRTHVSLEEYTAARAIATAMGGLPLALDQAGAYIEESRCGLTDFVQLSERLALPLLRERPAFSNHPASVVKTFSLAFEKVQQINLVAADLLTTCSFLAPDAIPEDLLTQGALFMNPPLQAAFNDPFLFNAALRDSLAYSLLSRNTGTKTLSIHRLVQAVLKERLSAEEQQIWARRVIQMLEQSFPDDLLTSDYRRRCEQLLPHALLNLSTCKQGKHISISISLLSAKVAWYFLSRGQYGEAEPLWLEALQIAEQLSVPDQVSMMYSLNGLAMMYTLQGKFSLAEHHFQRALHIWEQKEMPVHPQLAHSLHGLALLSRDRGEYKESEDLFQRALDVRNRTQGEDHPWTGMTLHDLALLSFRKEDYARAEYLFQRALQIWELIDNSNLSPYLARCLNNLAALYALQGRSVEANALTQRAFHIWDRERHTHCPY